MAKQLFIKNMVCNRCILVVKNELDRLGHHPVRVQLGEAELPEDISHEQLDQISKRLNEFGFEIIDDSKSVLIEKIKNVVIQLVHYSESQPAINYSHYLASQLSRDYNYLSRLFSDVEGITLEKYIILQKIERVKELLVYNELTLSEIAFRMGYSSVAHLSAQFKKVTGLTPSFFKQVRENKRKSIDSITGKG